jgi:transposase
MSPAASPFGPVSTTLSTLPTAEQLPTDVATLQRMIVELLVTLRQERQEREALEHRLDRLLRRLYGPKSERFDPNQPLLFAQADQPAAADTPAPPSAPTAPPRRCRPHGRRRLPMTLPREVRHHELPQAARLCPQCGQARNDIGVDSSTQLEYRPASLVVVEHVLHKYACPCCCRSAGRLETTGQELSSMSSQEPPPQPSSPGPPPAPDSPAKTAPAAPTPVVIAASRPPLPIAKGLPGPGLLAHLIVSKYTDHLPLYRLERIYERQGVFLPRSTLCDWLAASAALLRPLWQRLVEEVLQSRALHTDDTPVKLQDPATHQLSTARLWVYLGDRTHPYNVFDFTTSRKRDGPQQFLASYQGYLHADAFAGYDCLYLPEAGTGSARIIEVACNAHARRKFYEARPSDAWRSHEALAYYGQLYELERGAQRLGFDDEQTKQMRQQLSLLILEKFRAWLQEQRAAVLPKSPMGEAISYALNNWSALIRYTEAGFLAIDNNAAEREMKRIAIGRKNWLQIGSQQGGQTAAVLFSFTATCQRLGVEPWAYLENVLTRLPGLSSDDPLDELLPDRWQAARLAMPTAKPSTSTTPDPESNS